MDITKPAHHEVEKLDLPAACPPPEHHDAENGNPHLDWRVWPVSAVSCPLFSSLNDLYSLTDGKGFLSRMVFMALHI